jgi:ELWxxDGT repeat protein
VAGDKLFMVGEQEPYGRELWVLDDSGIHMAKDINPDGHGGLAGAFFTEFKGKLVFSANPPASGQEVWVSDGTSNGTKIIKDLNPGPASSFAISPVNIGDTLYYSADDGTGGEIWRILSPDGQPEKFTDIPGGGAWGPELARIGKTYVFSASDAVNGTELWKITVFGSTLAEELYHEDIYTKISPNPVSDYFIVEIPDLFSLPAVISLYNISGERIMETEVINYSMTFNADKLRLCPGLYFIRVEDGTKHHTIKFLVI